MSSRKSANQLGAAGSSGLSSMARRNCASALTWSQSTKWLAAARTRQGSPFDGSRRMASSASLSDQRHGLDRPHFPEPQAHQMGRWPGRSTPGRRPDRAGSRPGSSGCRFELHAAGVAGERGEANEADGFRVGCRRRRGRGAGPTARQRRPCRPPRSPRSPRTSASRRGRSRCPRSVRRVWLGLERADRGTSGGSASINWRRDSRQASSSRT